jgi:hypothetical protein
LGVLMTDSTDAFNRKVLWAASAYFGACGGSAIAYPKVWLFVSGLPTTLSTELELAFGVAGVYLLAFAFGSAIAALRPMNHPGLILTLAAGNVIDFLVTLKAVAAHHLPILNGSAFIAITVIWASLLGIVYVKVKRG